MRRGITRIHIDASRREIGPSFGRGFVRGERVRFSSVTARGTRRFARRRRRARGRRPIGPALTMTSLIVVIRLVRRRRGRVRRRGRARETREVVSRGARAIERAHDVRRAHTRRGMIDARMGGRESGWLGFRV